MSGKQSLFPLDSQPPINQLTVSLLVLVIVSVFSMTILTALWVLSRGMNPSLIIDFLIGRGGDEIFSDITAVLVIQQLSIFIIPVIIIGYMMKGDYHSYLGLELKPGMVPLVLIVILSLFLIPVTGFTGRINEMLSLPQWMSGLEEWFLRTEMEARETTNEILGGSGEGSLILEILVIAFLPAIGEELFFRGFVQQTVEKFTGRAFFSVIITALIFSALHFQFFGFLPRFILGLVYGLLFLWSRSLWLPITGHFINNLLAVFASQNDPLYDELGSTDGGSLLPSLPMALFSLVLCLLTLHVIWKVVKERNKI